jgi:alpha-1,6-mannosyltransferase
LLLLLNVGILAYFYRNIWLEKVQVAKGTYVLIFLSAIFAPTNLSQDVYRFLWDGKLILNGINPHDFRPKEIINQGAFSGNNWRELYRGMGSLSQRNYSCYPFEHKSIQQLLPWFQSLNFRSLF